uniref:C2H2-type domain-containing protein n=1 Tax=Angiostrongylus cantonensis TaxID=6313 RepID=A0A0K0D9B6_ANGCA
DHFLPGPSLHKIAKAKVLTNGHQKPLVTQRNRWHCGICGKSLSSKRSYDEHMNIHNDARPFACDHCDYAAASQMTLRRHKLRSHTARRDWGYKCPYCYESYMEPASYQQHVQSRHFGRSATFGCPYTQCNFHSKCFRHFREHLAKHNNYDCYVGQSDRIPFSLPDEELNKFLVDDEYGTSMT